MKLSPQQIAERSANAMWAGDQASKWAGLRLEAVRPGEAVLTLRIEPHHCNGHDICHGGVIFTLADSAFAFACNTYNEVVVAQHCDISFVAPVKAGAVLRASAREISRTGRSGIYDIAVADEDGRIVALFRGNSRVIQGQHFDPQAADEP